MKAQLLYYPSRLNGELQPLPVCATDAGANARSLILDLSPGAIADLGGAVQRCQQLATWAAQEGGECVVARPCGMGPGSVYQGPAEVDVFDAIEALSRCYPIDDDRICVMGGSMGGAATWYMASHYPDQFAAAAPFCGYCDYRLWTKPGGFLMRTRPWEEYSWQSRGAAFRAENLSHVALWITHGEWDISIGGGVPVEHSRRMSTALGELGIEHKYVEVPKCGHGCMMEETLRPVLAWLCQQVRVTNPDRVRLVAHGLRHSRSHWVEVEQATVYGEPARVDAELTTPGSLAVATENVQRLALGPHPGCGNTRVQLDAEIFDGMDLASGAVCFHRLEGQWARTDTPVPAGQKRRGASGPIGDVFLKPLRLVVGTIGGEHESSLIRQMSQALPGYFKSHNGGVHRGVFDGESYYDIAVVDDAAITDDELASCNLLCLGTPRSNSVLAGFGGRIPVELGETEIRLANRTYTGKQLGLSACFPSPANPERLVVVTGGVTPEAITGATHLHLQLLPDYLVWDGDEMLDWGFYDNAWELA